MKGNTEIKYDKQEGRVVPFVLFRAERTEHRWFDIPDVAVVLKGRCMEMIFRCGNQVWNNWGTHNGGVHFQKSILPVHDDGERYHGGLQRYYAGTPWQ